MTMNTAQLARTDINLLVLFDVVFEERHLGRAAVRLGLTASAISHGLTRLRRLLNDPLFLRTPRGVVPTVRANELALPVADILARVRSVMGSAEPFDAARSRRRFVIAAPDAISAVFLPPLIARIHTQAPTVDLSMREAFPAARILSMEGAWDSVRTQLEARTVDLAVIPAAQPSPRFARKRLLSTVFVVAARAGHPFLKQPTLDRFCTMSHMVVSPLGDAHGFIDARLQKLKRTRRVALTVPNFMLALAIIASTDLLCAIPRNLAEAHGKRIGLKYVDVPLPLADMDPAYVIATKAALLDAGVAWLFSVFEDLDPIPA
jgi:DNA-binding transcriptional LysR family regulator